MIYHDVICKFIPTILKWKWHHTYAVNECRKLINVTKSTFISRVCFSTADICMKCTQKTPSTHNLGAHDRHGSDFGLLFRVSLRLCSVKHRAGYFSNLVCDWLSIVWAYSEQETENGPISIMRILFCLMNETAKSHKHARDEMRIYKYGVPYRWQKTYNVKCPIDIQ